MYGSIDGLLPDAASKIDRFIYEKEITDETGDKVISYIKAHDIHGIIARGPWAPFLEDRLPDIPVFPFTVDTFDILSNLNQASLKGYRSIGLLSWIGNQKNSYSYGTIHTIQFGKLHFYMTHIKTEEEGRFLLERMVVNHAIDAAIGDIEFQEITETAGIPFFPYQLSSEYLGHTIDRANYTVRMEMQKRKNHSYVEAITNIIDDASIITDKDGIILFANEKASALFRVKGGSNQNISEVLASENTGSVIVNRFIEAGQARYVLNVLQLSLNEEPCFSYLLSNVESIEKTEISLRRQQNKKGLTAKYRFENILYFDPLMESIIRIARRFASSDGTVLITGESGTGKEIFANAIHNESSRSEGPFVAINCAALSENLIESELFGYEKGAFTGALSSGKKGLFELAHNGTLFLDEIGELSVSVQAKLLRVLQEREVRHVGGDTIIPVNVRIIAATNKPLLQMANDGGFREDLYYRLSLLELRLPPLHSRPADIIPLFQHFIRDLAEQKALKIYWKDDSVFRPLLNYSWPGNIRELRNIAERAILLSESLSLSEDYIRDLIPFPESSYYENMKNSEDRYDAPSLPEKAIPAKDFDNSSADGVFTLSGTPDLGELETQYLQYLMDRYEGDKSKICGLLNISKPTLWRKLNGKYLK